MARETQKQKIARLEEELSVKDRELKEWKDLVHKLNNEIMKMGEQMDKGFEASGTYKQIQDQLFKLEQRNRQLEKELANAHKLNNEKKHRHNERGAGRKEKFSDHQKETIKMYRLQGKTLKQLAEMYECSVGLIHKVLGSE